jgi:hypothetical protein
MLAGSTISCQQSFFNSFYQNTHPAWEFTASITIPSGGE